MKNFRIHGDNIVECERITNIIIKTLNTTDVNICLLSPSTIRYEIKTTFDNKEDIWILELLPGFNKKNKKRWENNIFDSLIEAGSFLDETPDVIVTEVVEKEEKILFCAEFCSAVQAGNQAWQRSGRAFSLGRTGCPYLYITDFVKYELEPTSRVRKNLRFANAIVPFSYLYYSKTTNNFVAQIYKQSEEYNKKQEAKIKDFKETNFGDAELGQYIIKTMLGINTNHEKKAIIKKTLNIIKFLADNITGENFSFNEWKDLYKSKDDIINYSINNNRFLFEKTIFKKSHHDSTEKITEIIKKYSVGLASKDFPLGIIPKEKRMDFSNNLKKLFPNCNNDTLKKISKDNCPLVVAIMKGFKPDGSDDRPDRGLLPMATMASSTKYEFLSFIYGPILKSRFDVLDNNLSDIAEKNGFWKSIISLSNFVIIDSKIIIRKNEKTRTVNTVKNIYDTSKIKEEYISKGSGITISKKSVFSNIPIKYGEDDVDTAIHYLFTKVLNDYFFEGMCNPPGGDWSGFSVKIDNYEYRWLSLPRESKNVKGKRPDHIIELFDLKDKPFIMSIESKEKSNDLEKDVGKKLVEYVEQIMDSIPSVQREITSNSDKWEWGDKKVDRDKYEIIPIAVYLKKYAKDSNEVFKNKCELLFVMEPIMNDNRIGWDIEILTSSDRGKEIKNYMIQKNGALKETPFNIK